MDGSPQTRQAPMQHLVMDCEIPRDVGNYVCTVSVAGKGKVQLTELDIIDGIVRGIGKQVVAINAVGPPGIGKSMLFLKYAEIHALPTVHIQGRAGTIPEDLQGRWVLNKDTTDIVLGPLTSAIRLANDHGKACLIVDEINLYPTAVHPVFNNLIDYGKARTLDGTLYRLAKDAALHVFFTMNQDLIATQQLQEAFKERLVVLPMKYPPVDLEAEILFQVTGLDPKVGRKFARVADGLRKLHKNEHAFRTPPGTRELVTWVNLSRTLGVQVAFNLVIKNGLNLSKQHVFTVDKLVEAVGLADELVPARPP